MKQSMMEEVDGKPSLSSLQNHYPFFRQKSENTRNVIQMRNSFSLLFSSASTGSAATPSQRARCSQAPQERTGAISYSGGHRNVAKQCWRRVHDVELLEVSI